MLLTSDLLSAVPGIRHGFATRQGGVSTGDNASWNFGPTDTAEALRENRRRFRVAVGLAEDAPLLQVSQVHGAEVVDGPRAESPTEADAIVESRPGVLVGIRTADCAPILMAGCDDADRIHVAAVHAGWRGAVADIPGAAVQALVAKGVRPERIRAAIGPTIGLGAFEVGEEVIEAAQQALRAAPKTTVNARGRHHLDLIDLIRRLLTRAGVAANHIDTVGGCTFEDPVRYFSHRRDQGRTGRHIAAIAVHGSLS